MHSLSSPPLAVGSSRAARTNITYHMDSLADQTPGRMAKNPGAETDAAKADASVASIVTDWRLLTGGTCRTIFDLDRRTLIACSGGADSSALTLALADATSELVVAHVVHDLRPPTIARRDRDSAATLAASLGLPFVENDIHPAAQGGNAEATARRLRYEALANLAKQHGCRFIATAHHADDQLETVLMALMRGSGPRGLSGIARTRPIEDDLALIRPMLQVTREDARRICVQAKCSWIEDETNDDTTRLRAALRQIVIPQLERLRPGVAHRAVTAAQLQAGATELIDQHVSDLMEVAVHDVDQLTWKRVELVDQSPIVLGSLIQRAVEKTCEGKGLDHLPSRTINAISAAIGDGLGQERVLELRDAGALVTRATGSVRRKT